jgi:hypothetical protein
MGNFSYKSLGLSDIYKLYPYKKKSFMQRKKKTTSGSTYVKDGEDKKNERYAVSYSTYSSMVREAIDLYIKYLYEYGEIDITNLAVMYLRRKKLKPGVDKIATAKATKENGELTIVHYDYSDIDNYKLIPEVKWKGSSFRHLANIAISPRLRKKYYLPKRLEGGRNYIYKFSTNRK